MRARLVRSEHTPNGPRQQVVLYLGMIRQDVTHLALPAARFWREAEARLATLEATDQEREEWHAQLARRVPKPDADSVAQAEAGRREFAETLRQMTQAMGLGSRRRRR